MGTKWVFIYEAEYEDATQEFDHYHNRNVKRIITRKALYRSAPYPTYEAAVAAGAKWRMDGIVVKGVSPAND